MAWLCCTAVPQRECLWLRWGLLTLQTSNIFSCVAGRGAVICLLHRQNNSVLVTRCFASLQPLQIKDTHFPLPSSVNQSCSWWAEDTIHFGVSGLFCSSQGDHSYTGHNNYPCASLCSLFSLFLCKSMYGYDLLRCHVFISFLLSLLLSPLSPLVVCVCVCVCVCVHVSERHTILIFTMNIKWGSPGQRLWVMCVLCRALMLCAFMWRLRRKICQYQSLCAQVSGALHLLKGTVHDLLLKQNSRPTSKCQSTGPEPCCCCCC